MESVVVYLVSLALTLLLGGGAVGWFFSGLKPMKRQLKKLPLHPLSNVPEGEEVRVTGVVELFEGSEVYAPLSGRSCAAWHIRVSEVSPGVDSRRRFTKLVVDESGAADAFLIRDGSHTAVVNATAIEVALHVDHTGDNARMLADVPPELRDFLEARGIQTTRRLAGPKNYAYREGVIEAGETITVAGTARWELDPSKRGDGYRDVGKQLHLRPLASGKVLLSDAPSLVELGA
ncbi:MAG: hypothetical protein AAF645_17580 [Myxococcota bacterium]